MAALTLRSVKGSELTAAEIDANFTNLNTDKLSSTAAGYPAIRPTLNLDFANSQSVDPRITFTRASTATRVRQDGLIEVVASGSPRIDFDPATDVCKGLLIEEQRTNLLTYSENFDNAAWLKYNATITANATTAPDGTTTADTWIEDTSATTQKYMRTPSTVVAGTYTMSCFVKAASGTRYFAMYFYDSTLPAVYRSIFDVSSGAVTYNYNGAVGSIVPYGNGWYRCIMTATVTNTISSYVSISNSSTSNAGYTGDGTSGIYIWGAQLEVGSFATSYIPSSDTFTSRASTATYVGSNGLIQSALINVARYDYNPVNLALAPKLLLESASTNLLTYSEQFDNAVWTTLRATIISNAAVAPDGTNTADKLVEDTQTGAHRTGKGSYSFIVSTTYCLSVYVKAAERSTGTLGLGNGIALFGTGGNAFAHYDLIAGTCVISSSNASSAGIQNISNGWFRVWVVATCTTAGSDTCFATFLRDGTATTTVYTGDGTSGIYIWGAQLEASSFPTSYIPTVASQVTRAADISSSAQTTRVADNAVMTGTNFSSWYNQTEGAFLVNAYSPADRATSGSFRSLLQAVKYATYNSDSLLFMKNSVGQGQVAFRSNFTTDVALTSPVYGLTTIKAAGSYALNNFNYCANGSDVYTDTLGNIPVNVDRLILGAVGDNNVSGNLNGHISKLSYYPKRLTNSELQALTTG